jgi:flagellin
MSLSIATNIASLNAQRNLSISQGQLSKSMQRLSSGLRINGASDDAAGLAISENMRGQIRSMNQATKNANDGVSLIQTAEGSLNETSAILVRMRELAQQSSTGTVGSTERSYIQGEMNKLSSEVDRIANSTEFNGQKLLNGTLSGGTGAGKVNTMTFQIGARNNQPNDTIDLNIKQADTATIFSGKTGSVTIDGKTTAGALNVSDQTSAQKALDTLDAAIISISSERANLGATQNRLQSTINNLQVAVENTSAAESRIRDVDVASETATMTRNNILTQAGTAILSQANQAPQAALSLLR